MSQQSHGEQRHEFNEADNTADAFAILAVILIAVATTVYFVSGA